MDTSGRVLSMSGAVVDSTITLPHIYNMDRPSGDDFEVWHATYVVERDGKPESVSATIVRTAQATSGRMVLFASEFLTHQLENAKDAMIWFGFPTLADRAAVTWERDRASEGRFRDGVKKQKAAAALQGTGIGPAPAVRGNGRY